MVNLVKINKIITWLNKHDINEYTINDDLTIDVNGNVNLAFVTFTNGKLPDYIQFNYVKKIFNICNTNLTSLKGCPKECEEFYCFFCKSLTSLEGAPEECFIFHCVGCKNLTSLEGAPTKCKEFYCSYCEKLTSLEGAPTKCKEFDCSYCKNLTSLEGAPTKCKEFYCWHCKGNFTEEDIRKVCDAKEIYN